MSAIKTAILLLMAVCTTAVINAAPRKPLTATGLLNLRKNGAGSFASKSVDRAVVKLGTLKSPISMEGDLLEFTLSEFKWALNEMIASGDAYEVTPGIMAEFLVYTLEEQYPASVGSSSRWNGIDSATALHPTIAAASKTEFYASVVDAVLGNFDVLVYRSRD